jgi:glutamyl-tRNA synthetase
VISFVAPLEYDAKASKNWKEKQPLMHQLITVLKEIGFQINQYGNHSKRLMTRNEIGMGSNATLRLSLVGALKGPHLFDIVEPHWKKETIELKKAISTL